MTNIQSRNATYVEKFLTWDMKTISQSDIISRGYRLVGGIKGFKTDKKPVLLSKIGSLSEKG
jgi:hypothetical protein